MRLYDLKPIVFAGLRYFRGTLRTFGLAAAVTQMSPLCNRIVHRRQF